MNPSPAGAVPPTGCACHSERRSCHDRRRARLPVATEFNQEVMQQRMQSMSAEEREIVEQYQTQGIMQVSTLIVTPIILFIFLFVFAVCYLVMGKLLGGLLSYGQVLAIVAYGG